MKKPSRFLRVLGAASLVASLLVGAFGAATVSAQDGEDGFSYAPLLGDDAVYFPWVANDDESTGLGPADTSVTIQNLTDFDAIVAAFVGVGDDSLPGENGWALIAPFTLEAHASKTFSAAQLGIEEGDGAPVAFGGFNVPLGQDPETVVPGEDLNADGDTDDYEVIADSGGSWTNPGGAVVSWDNLDCLVIDVDGSSLTVTPAAHLTDPTVCGDAEFTVEGGGEFIPFAALGGVAKQAVDGENLPYTSDADSSVSGYNGLAGGELLESDLGWYLPIVQTNGGPGGPWNSIIRVANFGDTFGGGFIGAAAVNITIYPAESGEGELGETQVISGSLNAGDTWSVDLSDYVPEGFIGSAHIAADAPVFAMVDRVKVGYSDWITNTATNAALEPQEDGTYVLYAPDVRKDWFGWNTGINVANMSDEDNTVTIQYYGDNGVATQTAELHARGMTYFYDPSQAPQDNSSQDPETDPNANEIGAAIIISDAPVAVAVDATKYPESTTEEDADVYQALSYSATRNLFNQQFVPLVQKGNPDTGMGATSGIQIFNPNDVSAAASVFWHSSPGDTVGNTVNVTVNPNSMTFVYTMNDAQLSNGFVGSADVIADQAVTTVSTQVDYQVQFDGSAVWNGYNPCGLYRTTEEPCIFAPEEPGEEPGAILDGVVVLTEPEAPAPAPAQAEEPTEPEEPAGEPVEGAIVLVAPASATGGDVPGEGGVCGNASLAEQTTTDATGHFQLEVDPGDYCVTVLIDLDGDGAPSEGDLVQVFAPVTVDEADPEHDHDVVAEFVGSVLDVDVTIDLVTTTPSPALAGHEVQIFAGDATTTDLPDDPATPDVDETRTVCTASIGGTPTYTLTTDDTGQVQQLTLPGDYCAQTTATFDQGGVTYGGSAAGGTALAPADPAEDAGAADITLAVTAVPQPPAGQ